MSSQIRGRGISSSTPDFDLPEDVLSVIPTDPYDQLDLARKITSMAIASRVSNLETEAARLRKEVEDKDRFIFELQDRVSRLQKASQEVDSQLKNVLHENMVLVQERDSLAATVKKLGRDLAKLEIFKKQLLQSLNEDTPHGEAVDIKTYDRPALKAYPDYEYGGNENIRPQSWKGHSEAGHVKNEVTPYYITPRLTPSGTPNIPSANVSPRAVSAAISPKKSGAMTPTKSQYDGQTALTPWYPSSHQSSAANSPPRSRAFPGRTPRIDGKEFFRQARNRLSYEQFSSFLANIKELNAHKQTREETLRKAQEIFGAENNDLYVSFQGLLHRNVH